MQRMLESISFNFSDIRNEAIVLKFPILEKSEIVLFLKISSLKETVYAEFSFR